MSKNNYLETQTKRYREEWFKNHTVNIITAADATLIKWENPKSWNYGCRYLLHRRWLCVVGDIGEATYEWGQNITIGFLAGCDFDYFHGKCRASEVGRRFVQWDERKAAEAVASFLSEDVDGLDIRNALESIDHNTPKDEFEDALRRAYHHGLDTEILSGFIHAGEEPSCRAIGHWVGIKMAHEQLREEIP